MRPQRPISEQAKGSLKELLKKTKTKADFQRVQCIWLRATLGMSSDQVALSVGFSPATVKKLWSQYFSGGEAVLIGQGRGGRHRANLSLEEEEEVLYHFFEKAHGRATNVARRELKVRVPDSFLFIYYIYIFSLCIPIKIKGLYPISITKLKDQAL